MIKTLPYTSRKRKTKSTSNNKLDTNTTLSKTSLDDIRRMKNDPDVNILANIEIFATLLEGENQLIISTLSKFS